MTAEEIKQAYSMKEIVGRYGLVPDRRGYVPCPFHKERTASMKIYEKDYHCFGCGENGDIFSFIQKMEDIPFPEAFRSLGGTYGQESPRTARIRAAAARREKARRAEAETRFQGWKKKRLGEVCRLLRLLDAMIPGYAPLSDEWQAAIRMREGNQYKYDVLASGTRAEQEEMRALDE